IVEVVALIAVARRATIGLARDERHPEIPTLTRDAPTTRRGVAQRQARLRGSARRGERKRHREGRNAGRKLRRKALAHAFNRAGAFGHADGLARRAGFGRGGAWRDYLRGDLVLIGLLFGTFFRLLGSAVRAVVSGLLSFGVALEQELCGSF